MLKPALLYKEQLLRKFSEVLCTKDYYYYIGYDCGSILPKILEGETLYQYASVDGKGNIIGYLAYEVDIFTDTVKNFGLISFDKGNCVLGRDLFRKLEELISTHHKVEWCVVDGNPVKRHYDKFCKKHNGRVLRFRDKTKDLRGKYIDTYLYEIIK